MRETSAIARPSSEQSLSLSDRGGAPRHRLATSVDPSAHLQWHNSWKGYSSSGTAYKHEIEYYGCVGQSVVTLSSMRSLVSANLVLPPPPLHADRQTPLPLCAQTPHADTGGCATKRPNANQNTVQPTKDSPKQKIVHTRRQSKP